MARLTRFDRWFFGFFHILAVASRARHAFGDVTVSQEGLIGSLGAHRDRGKHDTKTQRYERFKGQCRHKVLLKGLDQLLGKVGVVTFVSNLKKV